MSFNRFIIYLIVSCLLSFCTCLLLGYFVDISAYLDLTLICIGLFCLISFAVYFLAQKAIHSEDKGFFISVIFINILFKILLSFLLLVAYAKYAKPQDKNFVLPFLMVYLIFTIFETYFLSLKSRENK